MIESLPNTISIFWRTHLQDVDFADNCLNELPSYIFELEVGAVCVWVYRGHRKMWIPSHFISV